jgi:hypothetical protein
MIRSAAGLAAVAGLGLLVASLRPTPTAAMTVLQDAREAVKKTKTVRFEMSVFEAGKAQDRAPSRIRILAPGHVRLDEPDGNYTVSDLGTGATLRVEPGANRARRTKRRGDADKAGRADPYEFFRRLDRRKAGDLPREKIGEVEAVGFEVVGDPFGGEDAAGVVVRVWVHPETKLPLRMLFQPKATVHSYGEPPAPNVVWENFVFDEPIDRDLFSLDPPKGFEIAP